MAKQVKVRAYKKLGSTGKIQDVDAHMREVDSKMSKLTKLTENQLKGVDNEIASSVAKINKEKSYSPHLRNTERIYELKFHIKKLKGMKKNGWNAPNFS